VGGGGRRGGGGRPAWERTCWRGEACHCSVLTYPDEKTYHCHYSDHYDCSSLQCCGEGLCVEIHA